MNMFSDLTITLRLLALSQLLLLCLQAARQVKTAISAQFLGLFIITVIGHLLNEQTWESGAPLWSRLGLIMLSSSAPWAFWLWVKSWFDSSFLVRPLYFIPPAMTSLWVLVGFYSPVVFAPWWVLGVNGFSVLFIGLAVFEIRCEWNAEMLELRRKIRLVLALGVLTLCVLIILKTTLDAIAGQFTPYYQFGAAAGIFGLSLVANLAFLELTPRLFTPAPRPQAPMLPENQKLAHQLTTLMEVEQIFCTPGLTIGALAKQLDTPEYKLRKFINQELGFDNFNTFLNTSRIQLAAERLRNTTDPILNIALEVGFNSLPPFNRAFRKILGCSPSGHRTQGQVEV